MVLKWNQSHRRIYKRGMKTSVLTFQTAKPRLDSLEGRNNSPGMATGSDIMVACFLAFVFKSLLNELSEFLFPVPLFFMILYPETPKKEPDTERRQELKYKSKLPAHGPLPTGH
ncbi:hypothetical protein E5288_WYG020536 [Bos mutus]|uniref:Uncharacterized protein n=1 Tax=Bos mutus TaxID=72004 RepID=A0A6B0RIA4_9CETA|nr:hypothetical protein [Bos mutus]